MTKTALVLGAGGFIGSHMVKRLRSEGYWVRGVDLKEPEFTTDLADEFITGDLTNLAFVERVCQNKGARGNFYHTVPKKYIKPFDEIYQFAADMGGAGFVFSGENDADIMHNSCTINLNVLNTIINFYDFPKIFYSSSACMYPEHNQLDPDNPNCSEDSAYPANPDSEYGWEKLFSERLYLAYARNHRVPVRIARYHNIYGPQGTYQGGREKAPAAICRKVSYALDGDSIEVWGDGNQTRSFLYIDDCIEATRRLMESEYNQPVNIGSEEMVSINQLVDIVAKVSGKTVEKNHIDGPLGVRGRNSDNTLIRKLLEWDYEWSLEEGIKSTYDWIDAQ
jgi:GDP-D-mannose 3', 5'-epimerase